MQLDDNTAKKIQIETIGNQWSPKLKCHTFYTWSKGQGLRTLFGQYQQGVLNNMTFAAMYNQAVGGDSQCGPGLYISTSMTDSCSYGDSDLGILVKVVVPVNIAFIDAQDCKCMNLLRKGNPKTITKDVYDVAVYPNVLVKYMGSWYCLKTTTSVTFGVFNGEGVSVDILKNAYNDPEMKKYKAARAVFLAQLKPDLQAAVQAT